MKNQVLILTYNSIDATILESVLRNTRNEPYRTVWLTRLDAGLARLRQGDIDIVLTDLNLADSVGLNTFNQLFALVPHIPILILSAYEEEPMAVKAVQLGAQAYLSKGYFASSLIPQSLRSIIQRKAVEAALYKEISRAEIAMNSIGDAVICTDRLGNIDYMNMAAEELTGWAVDDACGRPIADVFKIINGVSRVIERNTVELALKRNKSIDMPANTVLIKKDGSEASIE